MTDFNPREGAVERFQEVTDYSGTGDGAQNEKEVRLLADLNNSGGIDLVEALGISMWLEQVIQPALRKGIERLKLLGYEGESADVRAFLGPDNCLSISLSGVRFADVGTAILNEQGDELFLISDDLVGTEVEVTCVGYGSIPSEVAPDPFGLELRAPVTDDDAPTMEQVIAITLLLDKCGYEHDADGFTLDGEALQWDRMTDTAADLIIEMLREELEPQATADDEVPMEALGENMGGAVLRRFGLVSDR